VRSYTICHISSMYWHTKCCQWENRLNCQSLFKILTVLSLYDFFSLCLFIFTACTVSVVCVIGQQTRDNCQRCGMVGRQVCTLTEAVIADSWFKCWVSNISLVWTANTGVSRQVINTALRWRSPHSADCLPVSRPTGAIVTLNALCGTARPSLCAANHSTS